MIGKALTESMPSTEDVLRALGLQYERNMNSFYSMAAAFTLGALAGATIALLATPRSGPEMRRELAERADQLRNTVNERMGTHAGSEPAR